MEERNQDAENSSRVFDIIAHSASNCTIAPARKSVSASLRDGDYKKAVTGESHFCAHKPAKNGTRIPWSKGELSAIAEFYLPFIAERGTNKALASLMTHIQNSPMLMKLFHPNHLVTNERYT